MRSKSSFSLSPFAAGLIFLIIIVPLFVMLFTKNIPFVGHYEIKAAVASSNSLAANAPVRVAGVDVGKVTQVQPVEKGSAGQEQSIVTMEVQKEGQPVYSNATIKLRPRLFLEGNFFVELHPGTPDHPEMQKGDIIPVNQTSSAVQLDEILTTLQSDDRENIRVLLDQLGDGLVDYHGARGLAEAAKTSPAAFRDLSIVNEALLGTEPHDLSKLVRNTQVVMSALGRTGQNLPDLITNLRKVTGALASEQDNLRAGIRELPPTLEAATPAFNHLNANFPKIRAFAREALPGVRTVPRTLRVATPFVNQTAALMSKRELGGAVRQLRLTTPPLARFTRQAVPLLEQTRRLSACMNNVVIPWSNDTVPDQAHKAVGKVYQETAYSLTGLNGESRSGDANGQYIRVLAGGGPSTIRFGSQAVGPGFNNIDGVQPSKNVEKKPPFRGNQPCENQQPPDLRTNPQQFPVNPPGGFGSNVCDAVTAVCNILGGVVGGFNPADPGGAGNPATGGVPPIDLPGIGLLSVRMPDGKEVDGKEFVKQYKAQYMELLRRAANIKLMQQYGRTKEADAAQKDLLPDQQQFFTEMQPRLMRVLSKAASKNALRNGEANSAAELRNVRMTAKQLRVNLPKAKLDDGTGDPPKTATTGTATTGKSSGGSK